MAAPAFGSIGTYLEGSLSTAAFAVPASVASGDIIVIPIFLDAAVTVTAYASGFAEAENLPIAKTGGQAHTLHAVWKRATGADSGTYSFTLSGSTFVTGAAIRYTGCVASGNPWDPGADAETAGDVDGTVSPACTITTAGADRMLVWAATNWIGGAWTPPTGYTERIDSGAEILSAADKVQASAGSTGSVTGTCAGSGRRLAWLGGLIGTTTSASSPVYVPTVAPSMAAISRSSTW